MLELDHIVFAGSNIEEASKQYGNKLAVKSVKGGEHEDWGTYNYLAHFSNDCYIEWLGIHDLEIAKKSENPLIQHLVFYLQSEKQGPFQFALRTNKLDSFITHFKENNIPYVGPVQGKRKKPDGSILTWRMIFPTYDYTKEMLPFLIEWNQSDDQRFDVSLVNHQAITSLQYGGTTIERFATIYDLPFKKRKIQKAILKNCRIHFTNELTLGIDLN